MVSPMQQHCELCWLANFVSPRSGRSSFRQELLFQADPEQTGSRFFRHTLEEMLLDSQSRPSYRPSPDVAQVLWMYLLQQRSYGTGGTRSTSETPRTPLNRSTLKRLVQRTIHKPRSQSGNGAKAIHSPLPLAQGVQAQLVCDLSSIHGVGQILFVGEDQQDGIPQLILQEARMRGRPTRYCSQAKPVQEEFLVGATRQSGDLRGFESREFQVA